VNTPIRSPDSLRKCLPGGIRIVVPDKPVDCTFTELTTGAKLVPDQLYFQPFHAIISLHGIVRADHMPCFIMQTESFVEEIYCAAAWHTNRGEIFEVYVKLGDTGNESQVVRTDGEPLAPICGLEFYLDPDAEPPYLILYGLDDPNVEDLEP
jgi:hypothetical protein